MHIRDGDMCSIFHKFEAIMPNQCPNGGCGTFRGDKSDLEKHMGRHCHLNAEEGQFPIIKNTEEVTVSRRIPGHRGLPNENTIAEIGKTPTY